MLQEIVQPRFSETDALGHINNTVFPVWFEAARTPLFRIFTPDLNVQQWKLIIARVSIDYHGETHYGQQVEVRTWVSRIGNSSFEIYQEAWQNDAKCVSGTTVAVHFDYQHKKSTPLTEAQKALLQAHSKA
ncbi:thioesterase family protein [Chromatiaceae bacterium AAb-1]|nr:thioesterase family protein [Chromatiaceae bacterium AAb-1]